MKYHALTALLRQGGFFALKRGLALCRGLADKENGFNYELK